MNFKLRLKLWFCWFNFYHIESFLESSLSTGSILLSLKREATLINNNYKVIYETEGGGFIWNWMDTYLYNEDKDSLIILHVAWY